MNEWNKDFMARQALHQDRINTWRMWQAKVRAEPGIWRVARCWVDVWPNKWITGLIKNGTVIQILKW
jgi:hypothetical protein